MDMRAVSNITDYFVICSAPSTRRVATIARGMEETLAKKGIKEWHAEGKETALWVLIDYGDVIAHIFHDTTREFYDLERLWNDAPKERYLAQCTRAKSKRT
jgi:ribosome-associated protein